MVRWEAVSNHFIEIQVDGEQNLWIMIHSGSRNLGKKVADHYNKIAVKLNKKWHTSVPPEYSLAFLPIDTNEAQQYKTEMNYCIDFALGNRMLMMERVVKVFNDTFELLNNSKADTSGIINIAHNYARFENHFGENVIVHRKGATSAKAGEIGIIPGSQGTCSYIVEGLGNVQSFKSCSHGAGRLMSRSAAIKTLDLEKERNILDYQGIIHSLDSVNSLDEAPSAYKNIDDVMRKQSDLVKIKTKLFPLAVIKG